MANMVPAGNLPCNGHICESSKILTGRKPAQDKKGCLLSVLQYASYYCLRSRDTRSSLDSTRHCEHDATIGLLLRICRDVC